MTMLSGCIVPPFPVAHVERVPTGLRLEQSDSASCVRPDVAAVASDPKRADAAMLFDGSGLLAIRDTRGSRCERASGKNSITDARRVAQGGPAMTLTTVFRRFREAGWDIRIVTLGTKPPRQTAVSVVLKCAWDPPPFSSMHTQALVAGHALPHHLR